MSKRNLFNNWWMHRWNVRRRNSWETKKYNEWRICSSASITKRRKKNCLNQVKIVAKSILETIISVKTFREDAKHATFVGLISPKLITLSVSIGHCPLKGFVKQRCTALERAMAWGPRFFSGCFVSFLLFLFSSSVRFARSLAHSFLHSRSTVSRGISKNQYRRKARRGRKKNSISPSPPFLFTFFSVSTFFFCNENCAVESLVPLWSPEERLAIRINSIFEEENSRRKWQREPTGTEEARENLFSQKCSAASVQSLPLPAE